jgi:hypothetical protein
MPPRGGTSKDKPQKEKAAKKVATDEVKIVVNKDYLGQRWDISPAGNIGVYQAADDDGNAIDFAEIIGKILAVKHDKSAMIQKKDGDEEDPDKPNARKKVTH